MEDNLTGALDHRIRKLSGSVPQALRLILDDGSDIFFGVNMTPNKNMDKPLGFSFCTK